MATSGDGRAEESSRRDSFGALPRELGQDLPAAPRPKYDDPAVAVTVLDSERTHLDAVFNSPNRQAARDARAASLLVTRIFCWRFHGAGAFCVACGGQRDEKQQRFAAI